jgi:urease accessory protein
VIRVVAVLGNLDRGFIAPEGAAPDELRLSPWDAQKRRLRKRTRAGRDVAVALDRPGALADGDVLYAGPDAVVVVRVDAGEVVVFRLSGAPDPTSLAANAVRLGHVLGNQHWPVRLRPATADQLSVGAVEIVVPLSLDRRVVDAVIRAHRLEGVSYSFRPAAPGEATGAPAALGPHADDVAYGPLYEHRHDHQDEHAAGGAPDGHAHLRSAGA